MEKSPQEKSYAPFVLSVTLILGGLLLGGLFFQSSQNDFRELIAPIDRVADERIRQARGLQRVGKWNEAAEIFQSFANDGHPVAMFHLAKAYGRGWGVPVDLEESRQIFLRAAQYQFRFRGEVAYELGRLYQRSAGDDCPRIAYEWFLKAVDWNYPKAHVQLATHLERGFGIDQNISEAVAHYEAATAAGFENAAIKFARVLNAGRGGMVAQPTRAYALARVAMEGLKVKADAGGASSAKLLGRLYRDGEFVDQDIDQALLWLRRASELGDAGAMHDLAHLMLVRRIDENGTRRAVGWLRRAAALGHGGALTSMGRFHLQEKYGLARGGAVSWLERGIATRHGGAMEELARLLADGDLVPRDLEAAIDLAREGSELGHLGSRTLLGELIEQSIWDKAQAVNQQS